ncbi:MAG: alpha-glucan family phosphorylase, partial [Proteobacteria bacterium]|nr:alpha-glucan family phosphorylase [Pseudomonadota bacterium]
VDTWLANEIAQLYSDCLGAGWRTHLCRPDTWRHIEHMDESELWTIKVALKRRLLDFVARRHQRRRERLGVDDPRPRLRSDRLTIGVARRFATYKRAMLMFEDLDRAKALITDPERPLQFIFAGKAHPADGPGKALLRRLCELSRLAELRDHVVVVENYDMNVSRHLLEGCDLWLNMPRRPLEACGTSGMKAVFNATLNCSTLDGWWDEACDGENGFVIGDGQVCADPADQDRADAAALLATLEGQVVPMYYDRNHAELPMAWLMRVKRALKTLAWRYNADRMVMDYARRLYVHASKTSTAEILD